MSKKRISDADRDKQEQVQLFEKFLDAVEAGHQVSFRQTSISLELDVHNSPDPYYDDRQNRIRLIKRTIQVLQAGLGTLVATKESSGFEFWVESSVRGGLPLHRWMSRGFLYDPNKLEKEDAEDYGLAPLNLYSLGHRRSAYRRVVVAPTRHTPRQRHCGCGHFSDNRRTAAAACPSTRL